MSTSHQSPSFGRLQLLGYISLCLIWGSTWLAIRVVVRDVPPFEAAALRFLAAGVLLLGMAMAQRRSWPRGADQWNAILVLSMSMMAVPYGLLFWAEQYVTGSISAIVYSAMPLTVALFTPVVLRHRVPRQAVYATVIGFGALLSLFSKGDLSLSRQSVIGGLAVLAAMALSAWSALYAKQRLHHVDSVMATGLQLLFGCVALFWATWALEPHRSAMWTKPALAAMAFLTLFGSAAAFVIYYWLLKKLHPYQLSTISLIIPVIALLEDLLWGETVNLFTIVTICLVLGSVHFVLRSGTEKEPQGDNLLMLRDGAE